MGLTNLGDSEEFIKAVITSVELKAFCLDTVTVLSNGMTRERTGLARMCLSTTTNLPREIVNPVSPVGEEK